MGDELHELRCHHEFHASCIRLWLQGSNTCPICRLQLPEADAEDEQLESKVLVGEEDKESDKDSRIRQTCWMTFDMIMMYGNVPYAQGILSAHTRAIGLRWYHFKREAEESHVSLLQ